jgi:hypothetical protein
MLKQLLIMSLLLALSTTAFGAEATSSLSWTAPDTREDGTPLAPADIAEYRVYYAVDSQVTTSSTTVTLSGTVTAETVALTLTPRTEPYVVSFAVATVDTEGRVSALSEIVSKTFAVNSTAAPMPPTNLIFTVTCTFGCTIGEL